MEDVERYKAALKITNSRQNDMYSEMLNFKDICEEN
jgi:hypothetical protein